jgi:hypothetical protein
MTGRGRTAHFWTGRTRIPSGRSLRVASNGVDSVAWQQISVGMHYGGELVDVHVTDRLLEASPRTKWSTVN